MLTSILLAFLPVVSADGGSVRFEGQLPASTWLAIRFNLTADNDMRADGSVWALPVDESRMGGAVFNIQDGRVSPAYASPASLATLPPNEVGHVATPVGRVSLDLEGGESTTYVVLPLGHGGSPPANESWTQVAIARSAASTYWFEATWTRGVISWDVQTGPVLAEYRDEWSTGVHVGTYNVMGAASAGGLLARDLRTERDTIGWFIGDSTANWQESIWSCEHDGVECEPYQGLFGAQKVISKGRTDWRFTIDATVEVGSPSIALLAAELPGDDYLR